jgi:hypothetical protein
MSWLFSRALVEEYSADSCSDGAPSARLSGNLTPLAYLPPDRMTAFSRLSRFGMMFAPLTGAHGAAVLTSFLAAFPAKISAQQEKALESTGNVAECGATWPVSLAKYDPATSSWKIAQYSLLGDSEEFLATWPRWGSMRSGECWERTTPKLPTRGRESGLLPTPTATNTKATHLRGADKGKLRESRSYGCHGPLNPPSLEWLMGWPVGWTELKPLATDRCHEWQQQHSLSSPRVEKIKVAA